MNTGHVEPEPGSKIRPCPECGDAVEANLARPPSHQPCSGCGSLRWFIEALLHEVEAINNEKVPVVELTTTSKADAISLLVSAVVQSGGIPAAEESSVYGSILKREELGPTGIGRGFAFPHTRHPTSTELAVAIGFSNEGIEFESLDGMPVHTIALLISPANDPGAHLRTLEGLSKNLRRMM